MSRVGPTSKDDVDLTIVTLLEHGAMQSATHVEQMVLDMAVLLSQAFPKISFDHHQVNSTPFIARMRLIGRLIATQVTETERNPMDRDWISDTVRGWCAMAIAEQPDKDLKELVALLIRSADDPHFAVREWAWLAIRPHVVDDPLTALSILQDLLQHESGRVRRFAVESTRPRSVWGRHIKRLKDNPEMAEDYLAIVRCDPDPYVQTSLGNWINDTAPTRPDWIASLASSWLYDCDCKHTRKIVSRATRSL